MEDGRRRERENMKFQMSSTEDGERREKLRGSSMEYGRRREREHWGEKEAKLQCWGSANSNSILNTNSNFSAI